MSTTFYLVKGKRSLPLAHRHCGPNGLCVSYNAAFIRVNRSFDNLFLRICEFCKNGWWITGDYEHDGFNPIEFRNEFKKYKTDFENYGEQLADYYRWHMDREGFEKPCVAKDGTYWFDMSMMD